MCWQSSHDLLRYTCKAMGEDFASFIETVIGEPSVVSDHSSGGIITTWMAANKPELVKGLIIEDSSFFSVLPDEMQNTFVCKTFEITHNFLNQTEETNLHKYNYKNSYLLSMFGGLQQVIYNATASYIDKHPGEPVKVWYIPHSLVYGEFYINQFDPLFSETFYIGSWFDEMDQADILSRVECPVVYIKVITRYGEDGVLWAANSDEDAAKVESLLKDGEMTLVTDTGHDVKVDNPEEFTTICVDFLDRIR